MNREDKLRAILNNISSEDVLLTMSLKGYNIGLEPKTSDYENVARALKEGKVEILFGWFWTHDHVVNLQKSSFKDVSPDDIEKYLSELYRIIHKKDDLHWIERINLFHAFGLTRLSEQKRALKMIEDKFGYKGDSRKIVNLTDVSASNVSLMLKNANSIDALHLIDTLNDAKLMALFAKYQIYYYGSKVGVLNAMKGYVGTSKEALIPHTIASMISTQRLLEQEKEYIYDNIIYDMPLKVRNRLMSIREHN